MVAQFSLWGSTVAILALAAVTYREARLLRSLYKHPQNQGTSENG